jgi:hypothetical protein
MKRDSAYLPPSGHLCEADEDSATRCPPARKSSAGVNSFAARRRGSVLVGVMNIRRRPFLLRPYDTRFAGRQKFDP